jgi:hypothetical protein
MNFLAVFPASFNTDRTGRQLMRCLMLATAISTASLLGACQKVNDVTGSITGSVTRSDAVPTDPAGLRRYTEDLGRSYDAKPNDKAIVLRYARALRSTGQVIQATAGPQRPRPTTSKSSAPTANPCPTPDVCRKPRAFSSGRIRLSVQIGRSIPRKVRSPTNWATIRPRKPIITRPCRSSPASLRFCRISVCPTR